MIVVGHENGLIEVLDFITLNYDPKFYDAHKARITSVHYDLASKILATCSDDYTMLIWSLPEFYNVANIHPDFNTVYAMRILNHRFNSTLNIKLIRDIIFEKLIYIPKSHLLGYDDECFTISFELGLIAYGLEKICLFDLKNYQRLGSKEIDSYISSLCLTKFYIIAGTYTSFVYYIYIETLKTKKYIFLQESAKKTITFVASTNNLKLLVYSIEDRSFFTDQSKSKRIFEYNGRIVSGKFLKDGKSFVFIDSLYQTCFFKDYSKLIKISNSFPSMQIFESACGRYYIHKYKNNLFELIDLETGYSEIAERLRDFVHGKLKFSTEAIISSCLLYKLKM